VCSGGVCQPKPPVCGDGYVDPGEQCDDGAANSNTTPNACRKNCQAAHCGDGVVDNGEACDDGNADPNDGCTNQCTIANDSCSGAGFAQSPTAFALPTGYAQASFSDFQGESLCDASYGNAQPTYRVVDINGDAKPDLVVTYACGSIAVPGADPDVSKTKWKVHLNTGTGFAQVGIDWPLPTGYAKATFDDLQGDSYCDESNGYAAPTYRFIDINGDAKPDLVVTYACGSVALPGADPNVGKTKWKVHLNTGTGFAAAGTDWPVPTGYAKGSFVDLNGDSYCDESNGYAQPTYRFLDIDGDAKPDLIVTYACGSVALPGADPNVAKTKWWVHLNTGSGFANVPSDWALPTGYAKGSFDDLTGASNCDPSNGYAQPGYRLADIDGDGKTDMIVPYACDYVALPGADPNVGKTKWWVHFNKGNGFANDPSDWALPTGYAKGFFGDLSGDSYCDAPNGYAVPSYQLADLDGNGKLDMLVMYACGNVGLPGADAKVGKAYWLVHGNTGSGFTNAPSTWCLPTGYAKGRFVKFGSLAYCDAPNGYAKPAYRVTNLVQGSQAEMVVTYACGNDGLPGTDPDVGKTKWNLH
jgi:cysteine-rich repeat protein